MIRTLKVIYAVMLFLCLAPMPYGYFQLVRFLGMVLFGFFAYSEYKAGNEGKAIVYLALGILFQPLIKIALGRTLWNVVDVAVGVWLLVTKKEEETK